MAESTDFPSACVGSIGRVHGYPAHDPCLHNTLAEAASMAHLWFHLDATSASSVRSALVWVRRFVALQAFAAQADRSWCLRRLSDMPFLLDQLGGIWEIILRMTHPKALPTELKRSL